MPELPWNQFEPTGLLLLRKVQPLKALMLLNCSFNATTGTAALVVLEKAVAIANIAIRNKRLSEFMCASMRCQKDGFLLALANVEAIEVQIIWLAADRTLTWI